MLKKSMIIIVSVGLICTLTNPNRQAFAGGYMIPHQTARGLGLSNAMTAGVNDASAVFFKPAALFGGQRGSLLVSGNYVNLQNKVENNGRKTTKKHDDNL